MISKILSKSDDASRNIIFYSDEHGRFVCANKSFDSFADENGSPDLSTKLIGQSIIDCYSGVHHSRLTLIYAALIHGGLRCHIEHLACPSPSLRREYKIQITPVYINRSLYLRHESFPIHPKISATESKPQVLFQQNEVNKIEYIGQQQSLEPDCGDGLWIKQLDENQYVFLIADAMGHGKLAASAIHKLLLSLEDMDFSNLEQSATQLNQEYMRKNPGSPGKIPFITGLLMHLDVHSQQLLIVSFGHEGLIFTPAGPIAVPTGLPIGILSHSKEWPITVCDLNKLGNRFIAYTDGIVEQFNLDGECYGLDRLNNNFIHNSDFTLPECIDSIFSELAQWRGVALNKDDKSILGVQC